jgi:hypothetical protein
MPFGFYQYAQAYDLITSHTPLNLPYPTPANITGYEWMGYWLAISASRHAPNRVLYIGPSLNPNFVSMGYSIFTSNQKWSWVDVILLYEDPKQKTCHPNFNIIGNCIEDLEKIRDFHYTAICCDNIFSFIEPQLRANLASTLLSLLVPAGSIYIANQHIMHHSGQRVPDDWLDEPAYFRYRCYQNPPNDLLGTFLTPSEEEVSICQLHDKRMHITEKFSDTDVPEAIREFSSGFYGMTIRQDKNLLGST